MFLIWNPHHLANSAQPLTIREAAETALRNNSQIAAAFAGLSQATARQSEAHKAYLPVLGYSESDVLTNHAVDTFVYKLLQRHFSADDLTLNGINRPSPDWNFQSQLHVSAIAH